MFTVKATLQGETRRLSLAQSSFPTYDVLRTQVTRLFSINSSFYLTDLVFTPEDGARVVVGAAVHDEITYNIVVGPFSGRMWPNGVLRFKVVVQESFPMLHPSLLGTPSSVQDLSFVTPQPVPRQPSSISGDSSTLASNRLSMLSQGSRQSCCAVEEGKQEVKSIVDNFLRDFNGIMSSTFGDVPAVPPRSISPETVTAEPTSNVDDTNDVTIPGAFYRPTYIVPKEDAPMHRGITCDFCGQRNIRGVRHHCLHCPDFDLCDECVNERGAKSAHQVAAGSNQTSHPHSFEEIKDPRQPRTKTWPVPQRNSASAASRFSTSHGTPTQRSRPVVHSNVVCDLCDKTVVGTRHKCLDCRDFDLCDKCYPRADCDHPNHQFIDIDIPGRVIVHRVYDRVETPTPVPAVSSNDFVVHSATCDMCDSRIRGIRHKCLMCPDFDTCDSCYRIVPEHHPKHTFIKLSENQDLTLRDPALLKKHNARCDECGKDIRGVRYKCLHPECPDYDLCAKCEALPIEVHPGTHPMLKMKSPDTIIPTVYRVGGTSLIESETSRVETVAVATATEPEPLKADASVYTEGGITVADASVYTERSIGFVDASVYTEKPSNYTDVPLRSNVESVDVAVTTDPFDMRELEVALAPLPSLPFLPSVPTFALNASKEEPEPRTREPVIETSLPEVLAESSFISAFIKKFPQLKEEEEEVVNSSFVCDVNVEDGQVFPAGAEFVKSWRVKNNGNCPWPEGTRLTFVAGDRMPAFHGAALSYSVGVVAVGEEVDVSAYDLKAPDVPGKYVSYWRLSDGYKPFGTSMWCDITVAAPSGPSSLGIDEKASSLESSEVIMPEPSPRSLSFENVDHADATDAYADVEEARSEAPSIASTPSVTASTHSTDYDTSESLFNEFDVSSDDELWAVSRELAPSNAPAAPARASPAQGRVDPEYVVLFDETSGDETW